MSPSSHGLTSHPGSFSGILGREPLRVVGVLFACFAIWPVSYCLLCPLWVTQVGAIVASLTAMTSQSTLERMDEGTGRGSPLLHGHCLASKARWVTLTLMLPRCFPVQKVLEWTGEAEAGF